MGPEWDWLSQPLGQLCLRTDWGLVAGGDYEVGHNCPAIHHTGNVPLLWLPDHGLVAQQCDGMFGNFGR